MGTFVPVVKITMNRPVIFPGGVSVPALGQGTWCMGQNPLKRNSEADALRLGLDLGMTLIDTAEMYHDAEIVVGKAVQGRRDEAYIVSKVLPSNASLRGTIKACEKSLKRMKIESMDLYLLHWPGRYPIRETLEAFMRLREQGKIAAYGVSNFDVSEMEEAWECPGGTEIATNQVLYNLECREVEAQLSGWCRQRKVPLIAYSPFNKGRLATAPLQAVARRHNAESYQVALAWLLHQEHVIVIPKSARPGHIRENHAAGGISLTSEDLEVIDRAFPPPGGTVSLQWN